MLNLPQMYELFLTPPTICAVILKKSENRECQYNKNRSNMTVRTVIIFLNIKIQSGSTR